MKEEEIIANLSHSYFNHLLKDVQPFLEYFDLKSIQVYLNNPDKFSLVTNFNDNLDNDEKTYIDYDIIERLFFMACLVSTDISLPFNYNVSSNDIINHKIKKHEWLNDIKPFGSKSKQGMVIKSLIFESKYIVIKKAKTSKFNDITMRDFCVGINLNKILHEVPFFVKTIGCFQYKNQFHIATEFIDGINLKNFIQNKRNTFPNFLNIFFQILLGLEIAQNKLNFAHYDLHTDNVILVPNNKTLEISLYGHNYMIKHSLKPVMIDFGLSSIYSKGQTLGQKNLETKGIYHYLSPGYDIYIFLLFCIDIAQSYNLSIFNGITNLLTFFKVKTNLSIKLITHNHIKCLRKGVFNLIPYQFINFIVENYSNYLDVDIKLQKSNDNCLKKQPLLLTLKQILDTNDELELITKSTNKNLYGSKTKGFIKSLIDNIKIYYWYKKKITLSQAQIKILINVDKHNLENLIDDLNLQIYKKGKNTPCITVEQKNLFFIALDYYYLIINLELQYQFSFYNEWIQHFKETFVYKHIFKHLDKILYEERCKRFLNQQF